MCNLNLNKPIPRGTVCSENMCVFSSDNYGGQLKDSYLGMSSSIFRRVGRFV